MGRNSDKDGPAEDARAKTTLLWEYGNPGDLWKYTARGDQRRPHGDRDGPTSTDGGGRVRQEVRIVNEIKL